MKLTIKTKSFEIEYQDDYSKIELEVKQRLLDLINTTLEYESKTQTNDTVQGIPTQGRSSTLQEYND